MQSPLKKLATPVLAVLLLAGSASAQNEFEAIASATPLSAPAMSSSIGSASSVGVSPGVTIIDAAEIAEEKSTSGNDVADGLLGIGSPEDWTRPERLSSTLQVMLLMTVISLAPAVLLMTTCFVRVIVVLGLLRQALGTQQAPPSQVLTSITLFVTLLVMTPVWTESYQNGVKPYTEGRLTMDQAFDNASAPLRDFMGKQVHRTKNQASVLLFLRRLPESYDEETGELRANYALYDPQEDEEYVPLAAMLPAYMLSELKTAFLIGFQVYLPFVILDIVVASVTISMGMLMLPPVLISLPFKLLLFVLLDGWTLVIGMLMESIA
ncbi:flagellar type III secretion system pore protein FliP [Botrimarina colliarenosi]|nr:flagellar type III secretion system pore protein FliP [Botrimarina colliarenosi]